MFERWIGEPVAVFLERSRDKHTERLETFAHNKHADGLNEHSYIRLD